MRISYLFAGGFACLLTAAWAVDTRNWIQSEASEFEKGTLKGVSISSDGRMRLAPTFKAVFDSSVALLWAGAVDSKGTLYAGGAGGKLFAIDAQGKSSTVAEVPGGDIYAIAVNRRDEVFAATAPDGKVYRIVSGKPEVFYDTKTKYVWALRFDASGTLFVATGDPGQIHRVGADGKGSLLIDLEETHARSLAFDKDGNVIAGTEPGGFVLRVNQRGEGFILYQTARREVTSLVVTLDGSIYAAAVGTKPSAGATPGIPTPPPAPVPSPTPGPAGAQATGPRVPPPPTLGAAPSVSGGSEIYRISTDGAPRRVWSNAQHLVYSLALDAEGRVLAGTGNQGLIYRLDSDTVSTRLLDAEAGQVSSLIPGAAGLVYALTCNIGKIYQIGPGLEKTGTVESDVFDASSFSYWGRLRQEGQANGGSVSIDTRSGNLDRPQKNWSPWAALQGERIVSPSARFLQWRLTLHASPAGKSPEISLVDAAWQAKNVAPVIERIEATPANYKFPASSLSLSSASNMTLPPIGQVRRVAPTAPSLGDTGSQTMNYDKGWIGVRWRASDVNGDTLEAKVEIRGKDERDWKLLKDSLRDSKFAWDSTSWADGEYRVRVTVSDAPDNYPNEALTAQIESELFLIDNTPPQISGLTAKIEGERLVFQFKATDALSPLGYAEYSINGEEWKYAPPTTKLTDSKEHEFLVDTAKPVGAELTIAIKVSDANDNSATAKLFRGQSTQSRN